MNTTTTMFEANQLAEEFLQQEIMAIEVELVTTDKVFTHHNGYDEFYNNLDTHRDILINTYEFRKFDEIESELTEFLKNRNIDVTVNTVLYKVLLRKFLLAKIDALEAGMKMCQGSNYDYSAINTTNLNVTLDKFDSKAKSNYNAAGKWKKKEQKMRQHYINQEARKLMKKYPNSTKEVLAEDVFESIKKYDLKEVTSSTILKDYLDLYPHF